MEVYVKEYNYSDIIEINKEGIVLKDENYISFEDCRCEWAKENKINVTDTHCVAVRFSEGNDKKIIFYSKNKITIHFKFKGIFKIEKSRKKFAEMQMLLKKYGYNTYDLT